MYNPKIDFFFVPYIMSHLHLVIVNIYSADKKIKVFKWKYFSISRIRETFKYMFQTFYCEKCVLFRVFFVLYSKLDFLKNIYVRIT